MGKKYARVQQVATVKFKDGSVRVGLVPVSVPTWWRWVASGKAPRPFKLSPGVTVWDVSEIESWLAARKEAAA